MACHATAVLDIDSYHFGTDGGANWGFIQPVFGAAITAPALVADFRWKCGGDQGSVGAVLAAGRRLLNWRDLTSARARKYSLTVALTGICTTLEGRAAAGGAPESTRLPSPLVSPLSILFASCAPCMAAMQAQFIFMADSEKAFPTTSAPHER